MRKPKKQKKPLNDLSRSLTPFDLTYSARCGRAWDSDLPQSLGRG
jgi:hypothetical protein